MTRINCVPPEELNDRFLVAEYHELPRVFGLVKKAMARGHTPANYSAFDRYTMGTGHVKFFYTRLLWLAERQAALIEEMVKRKMRPRYFNPQEMLREISADWFGNWSPTEMDMKVNRERLEERLSQIKEKKKRKVITPYNEHELMKDETTR